MANDPTDPILDPEDVNDSAAAASTPVSAGSADPNDEIPVPIAMEPAEIDERAQVVEALRRETRTVRDDDTELRA
jgi:hypothetical protein